MKQYISLATPLNGISTYKDTLNLETGATSRIIKQVVLTGQESWNKVSGTHGFYTDFVDLSVAVGANYILCSHYVGSMSGEDGTLRMANNRHEVLIYDDYASAADFQTFLQQQYAAGTPVTVWYVLATAQTSTTTLPYGLSGTVEGYTTQATTPTPSSPVYPTENYINSFLDKKYLKYETATDTITTLPQTIIGDGQNISAYTIKGNMVQSGTPTPSNPIYPTECGDKTANLFDKNATAGNIYVTDTAVRYGVEILVTAGTYTVSGGTSTFFTKTKVNGVYDSAQGTETTRILELSADGLILLYSDTENNYNNGKGGLMLVEGSTAPSSYIPYGYKIPISLSQNTYNIYITEPLRKSLDGSNLYDTIESNGTLTRRVDANGDALATPTTEQVTVPTLTTTGTAEQFNVLTTLAPSEVSLTYHGWHEHSDTKYTTP